MASPLENSPLRKDPYTDPNLALRNFNAYFGKLREKYGDEGLRASGITPRVLAEIQATLRKVQMDPSATPEQHRQADRDANAMLVQKMTSPLTRTAPAKAAAPKAAATKPAPKPAPKAAPNPFADPNYALRQLNDYFGGLRKDYGEDAIRGAGFTPRDLAEMQASLRKLQMDPRATPEQHQQAYQQARDALAQRITTPLTAARKPVEVEVRGVRPPDGVGAPPSMPVPMVGNGDFRPTAAQIADYNAGRVKGQWNSDRGVFEDTFVPPPTDTREVTGYRTPAPGVRGGDTRIFAAPVTPPVPSATDYIASIVTPPKPVDPSMMSPTMLGNAPPRPVAPPPMAQPDVMPPLNIADDPSRGVIDNRIGPGFGKPMQPEPTLSDMFKGGIGGIRDMLSSQPTPTMPSTAPGILPGIMQQQPAAPSMNTQPGADFDRNVARQIFDSEFRTLREKYGDSGLRAAGFTPRTLASLQAPLTNVQKDNTISYDQSSAALENALKQLRGYNFGGAQPAAPMQPAAPAPLPAGAQQSPIPGYYRGGFAQRYR